MIVLIKGVYDYTLLDTLLLFYMDNDDLVLGGCMGLYGNNGCNGCMGRLDSKGASVVPYGCLTGALEKAPIVIIF